MSKTWSHPELGSFEYDDDIAAWAGTCSVPAFGIFKWEVDEDESPARAELTFDSPGGKEPSASAAALATSVIQNQEKIASLIAPALWEDFQGRGGDSGMWWHGDMEQVAENFGYGDLPCPKGPEDIIPAMGFTGISIREKVYGYKGPAAELSFRAIFEEEHGVGILTDGKDIIGTGYSCDADPFKVR